MMTKTTLAVSRSLVVMLLTFLVTIVGRVYSLYAISILTTKGRLGCIETLLKLTMISEIIDQSH